MKLVLFDLDNTIFGYRKIKKHPREHMLAFKYGIKKSYNIDVDIEELMSFSGKIDNQIISELLERKELEKKVSNKKKKKARYLISEYYKKNYKKEKMFMHKGIKQILNSLSKNKNIKLGIVSGNISQIGMIKLKRAGLLKYFEVFGFGDKAKNRNELVKKTAGKKYDEIFVIGDTIHDVNCGKYINATTIAVATGPYSTKELNKADYVFKDFKNYKKLIKIIEDG